MRRPMAAQSPSMVRSAALRRSAFNLAKALAIGDGDPMSVAAEIGQHLSRSAEGLLGVDDPVDPPQGDEMAREPVGIGEPCEVAEEASPPWAKAVARR